MGLWGPIRRWHAILPRAATTCSTAVCGLLARKSIGPTVNPLDIGRSDPVIQVVWGNTTRSVAVTDEERTVSSSRPPQYSLHCHILMLDTWQSKAIVFSHAPAT
jgi:hypothetical protein